MTSKTSILLIIQQNQGIDYQSLLSKVAPNYSNLNSARAALSRVLKDAVSFGMVNKQHNQLFLTDKGQSSLKVKMHDKLVIKLNQLMKVRNVANNPDPLVQHLSILLERGKVDPRLMDNARASVNFSIDDLSKVHAGLQENIRHLEYIEKTLSTQLNTLQELNFPAVHERKLEAFRPHVNRLISLSNSPDIQVETPSYKEAHSDTIHPIFEGLPVNQKGSRTSIPIDHLPHLVNRLPSQDSSFSMKAHVGLFNLELQKDKAIVRGPSELLHQLFSQENIEKNDSSEMTTQLVAVPQTPPPVPTNPIPGQPNPFDGPDDSPTSPPDESPDDGNGPEAPDDSPPSSPPSTPPEEPPQPNPDGSPDDTPDDMPDDSPETSPEEKTN